VNALVKSGRLAIVALVVAVLFAASLGAGYLLGQSAFRSAPPPARSAGAPPAPVPSEPAPAAAGGTVPGGTSGGSLGGTPAPSAANPPGAPAAPPSDATGNTPSSPPAPQAAAPVPVTPASPDAATAAPGASGAPPAPQQAPGSAASGAATPAAGGTGAASAGGSGVPAEVSRFHVQVGAFDTRQNAAALALRLRSLGYAVTLVEGPPYRVWVGGYVDGTTAQALADNLDKAGFPAILTPR